TVDRCGGWRALSHFLGAQYAEPLSGPEVPFTELVGEGGDAALPAFGAGQLIGRSAIDATLSYEWPIWVWLVGAAHVGVGNVFGDHLKDFDADLLRLSFGLGIRSIGSVDHRFQFLFALGTSPFSEGASIDSVRLVFGSVTGFCPRATVTRRGIRNTLHPKMAVDDKPSPTASAAICAALVIAGQTSGKATRDALFLSQFHVTKLPALLV